MSTLLLSTEKTAELCCRCMDSLPSQHRRVADGIKYSHKCHWNPPTFNAVYLKRQETSKWERSCAFLLRANDNRLISAGFIRVILTVFLFKHNLAIVLNISIWTYDINTLNPYKKNLFKKIEEKMERFDNQSKQKQLKWHLTCHVSVSVCVTETHSSLRHCCK